MALYLGAGGRRFPRRWSMCYVLCTCKGFAKFIRLSYGDRFCAYFILVYHLFTPAFQPRSSDDTRARGCLLQFAQALHKRAPLSSAKTPNTRKYFCEHPLLFAPRHATTPPAHMQTIYGITVSARPSAESLSVPACRHLSSRPLCASGVRVSHTHTLCVAYAGNIGAAHAFIKIV